MSEQGEPEIRVNDRRRFTAEGETKPDAPEEQAPTAEAADTAEAATEEPPPEAPSSEQPAQEPPPSFTPPPASLEMLVMSLAMQAEMELAGGDPSQPPNLALAQHSIDLLGVIKEKTKGNLELSEQRLLENSLTELRFRYVQKVQEINQQSKGGAESGD